MYWVNVMKIYNMQKLWIRIYCIYILYSNLKKIISNFKNCPENSDAFWMVDATPTFSITVLYYVFKMPTISTFPFIFKLFFIYLSFTTRRNLSSLAVVTLFTMELLSLMASNINCMTLIWISKDNFFKVMYLNFHVSQL